MTDEISAKEDECPGYWSIIIVDSLAFGMREVKGQENWQTNIDPLMDGLIALAKAGKCPLVVTAHLGKDNTRVSQQVLLNLLALLHDVTWEL